MFEFAAMLSSEIKQLQAEHKEALEGFNIMVGNIKEGIGLMQQELEEKIMRFQERNEECQAMELRKKKTIHPYFTKRSKKNKSLTPEVEQEVPASSDIPPEQDQGEVEVRHEEPEEMSVKLTKQEQLQDDKRDKEFQRFREELKKMKIKLSVCELLDITPAYNKLMREELKTKKKKINKNTTRLTTRCSAVIQQELLEKKNNPGRFIIPCELK